jgi:hypothetical protein
MKGKCKSMKIDIVKVASIAGTVLGIIGTVVSGWAGRKTMDETITKRVTEALAEQAE